MALLSVPETTTAALLFQLYNGNAPIDLTGATVTLVLTDKLDATVAFTGVVAVTSAALGKVSFTPATGDLVASSGPYYARFQVVDSGGKKSFYPSGHKDQWDILAR
jgi:hypothetical protein